MKSPASMRASKRSSRARSSAERTGFFSSAASALFIVSIAWVYMACAPSAAAPPRGPTAFLSLVATVDDALRLADERALEGVGRRHRDGAADADQGLDAVLHRTCDLLPVRGGVRRQHLAAHLDGIEVALTRHHQLVLARELPVPEDDLLDLRREQVDATDDEHVVAAADDLA